MLGLVASLVLSGPAVTLDLQRPKVAAIVVGSDTAAAGALQRELDQRLAHLPTATYRGAAELTPRLAQPAPLVPDLQAKRRAALLDQAIDAYYRDKAATALDPLSVLAKLQEDPRTPSTERVRTQLWRMAIFRALKDQDQEEASALAAITVDPKLEVDTTEFPPSVRDAINDLRARRARAVTVVLRGVPPGGKALVDGREVPERFETGAGSHVLVATAPGRRDLAQRFDASSDVAVTISLPMFLDSSLAGSLSSIAAQGAAGDDAPALRDLARRADADWLVLGDASGGAERVLVLRLPSGSPLVASSLQPAGGEEALAAWAEGRLASVLPPVQTAIATPRPRVTPRPPVGASPWAAQAQAVVRTAVRTQSLSGTGGRATHGRFVGAGPSISIAASNGPLRLRAEGTYLDYGVSYYDVTLPDGTKRSVYGGSTMRALAGAGAAKVFGGGDPDSSPSVAAIASAVFERHQAQDAKDGTNAPQQMFNSYQRLDVEATIEARIPISSAGGRPAHLTLFAGASPWGSWAETPDGASGGSPAPALSPIGGLALELSTSERVHFEASYRGDWRSVRFKGAATAPISNGMTDATGTEQIHSLSAGVTVAF